MEVRQTGFKGRYPAVLLFVLRVSSENLSSLTYNNHADQVSLQNTDSSISGAGKTGKIYVEEWN